MTPVEDDVFDLSDAIIRDEPYVMVRRIAPRHGFACRYEKIFKRDIEHGYGDFTPWAGRENYFLQWFGLHNVEHVVQAAQINFLPTRDIASVVTYDAGITVANWLRVQPRYRDGTVLGHPFEDAAAFLRLLRGCVAALWEVHRHGIVHCDVREDNICLQHLSRPDGERAVRLDFDRVILIDFAYSISPDRRLEQPLPIDPDTAELSDQFRQALREDRRAGCGRAVQQLDYRVDLFALGCMGERIVNEGMLTSLWRDGDHFIRSAKDILRQLRLLGAASRKPSGPLPHARLIAEIDLCLAKSDQAQDGLAFEVFRQRTHAELTASGSGIRVTPVTRMATPLDESAQAPLVSSAATSRARKTTKLVAAAAMITTIGLIYFEGSRMFEPGTPVTAPERPEVQAAPSPGTEPAAIDAAASQPTRDPFEEARERLSAQLATDDDQVFKAALAELMRLATGGAAGAADLVSRAIAGYRDILFSEGSADARLRALSRLRIAESAGERTAADAISAFEKAYDEVKPRIVSSTWWLRGDGTSPNDAGRWIEKGRVLAASGDRPAKLDQAFALRHGWALGQDRAKSVELYLQVIDSSKAADPFSTKLREAAVRGLVATLNAIVRQKDEAAVVKLQHLIEPRAGAGASDMQYYLGLFSECVRRPANLDRARTWYLQAAADAAWKGTAERKLRALGKWCPSDNS